jgi:hypothetical protein
MSLTKRRFRRSPGAFASWVSRTVRRRLRLLRSGYPADGGSRGVFSGDVSFARGDDPDDWQPADWHPDDSGDRTWTAGGSSSVHGGNLIRVAQSRISPRST